MYLDFFGLKKHPFSIVPDPEFTYFSQQHQDALAHLLYGIKEGGASGFVLLTGDIGTGKTTLCRCLLEQLPDNIEIALILNPNLNPTDLLLAICEEFEVTVEHSNTSLWSLTSCLQKHLIQSHADNKRPVLIIDESQNLSIDALEQVRLLTNLETHTEKLLQIILIGQPELKETIASPSLKQLDQRITARFHLGPLSIRDTYQYVATRLDRAGCNYRLFSKASIALMHVLSAGVPRIINVSAERSLLGAFSKSTHSIGVVTVLQAFMETQGRLFKGRKSLHWLVAVLVLSLTGGFIASRDDSIGNGVPSLPTAQALEIEDDTIIASPSDDAWLNLLDYWKQSADLKTAAVACAVRVTPQLRCVRRWGNLASLAKLEVPVVLHRSNANDVFYDPVTMLQDAENHDNSRIFDDWLGEFTLLFSLDDNIPDYIRPGDSLPIVGWIRDKLNAQTPRPGVNWHDYPAEDFDTELQDSVKRFQRESGLNDDGIIGPATLQMLVYSKLGAKSVNQ